METTVHLTLIIFFSFLQVREHKLVISVEIRVDVKDGTSKTEDIN